MQHFFFRETGCDGFSDTGTVERDTAADTGNHLHRVRIGFYFIDIDSIGVVAFNQMNCLSGILHKPAEIGTNQFHDVYFFHHLVGETNNFKA